MEILSLRGSAGTARLYGIRRSSPVYHWIDGTNNPQLVIKEVKNRADYYAGKQVDVFAIGKKGNDILTKTLAVVDNQSHVFDDLTFDNVTVIAETLTQKFVTGEYDKIELVYNQFKNAATQIVQVEQFLPLAPIKTDKPASTGDYIFEPSKEKIVLTLIPKSLKTQLYKGIRDSFASELGARMTAMHSRAKRTGEAKQQTTQPN